jgi:hypothetical protein
MFRIFVKNNLKSQNRLWQSDKKTGIFNLKNSRHLPPFSTLLERLFSLWNRRSFIAEKSHYQRKHELRPRSNIILVQRFTNCGGRPLGRSVIFIFQSYGVKLNNFSLILKLLEIKYRFDTYGPNINININIGSLPTRFPQLIEHDQIATAINLPCRNQSIRLFIGVSNKSHAVTRPPRPIKLLFHHCIFCAVTNLTSETVLGILNYSQHYCCSPK